MSKPSVIPGLFPRLGRSTRGSKSCLAKKPDQWAGFTHVFHNVKKADGKKPVSRSSCRVWHDAKRIAEAAIT